MNTKYWIVGIGAAIFSGAAPLIWANGGAFFDDPDGGALQMQRQQGTVYFGHVRDQSGAGVPGATVTISVPKDRLVYQIRTDARGHYRSNDVGFDVDPAAVQLSVEKPKYRLSKMVKLTQGAKKGDAVEIQFILQPA